ncbi:hypothetical protein CONPUDRAFT_81706 [Coniophora puteana RWD-64-598 SS2]|uniref:Uncharacterized protein n=1 Tax=Coniophora puteana (strain RWD-64-598) TaxID=741705 RepID=A0A5M3MTT9_CONPW|nr:uncharacterized protein CONPUDRAFT_81706 [Coniophora puteana RWD-64-598 SS2]EIW82164.1 hypothetical protein CONPUDRAFT_81706 [Coniophora puteana RWD-64-598 SS2]
MIHLDRNHNPLDPNANLITDDLNPHDLLQFESFNKVHDDPFFKDQDDPLVHDIDTSHLDIHQDSTLDPSTLDIAQSQDGEPQQPPPAPSSPPAPTAPQDDRSSSLSPAPETNSPKDDKKPSPQPPSQPADPSGEQDKGETDDPFSRQLTPLTELSPAPDYDDEPEKTEEGGSDGSQAANGAPGVSAEGGQSRRGEGTEGSGESNNPGGRSNPQGDVQSASRQVGNSSVRQPAPPQNPTNHNAEAGPSQSAQKPPSVAPSYSRAPSSESASFMGLRQTPGASDNAGNGPTDPKVVRILDLNAELLKICMESQSHALSITDPRLQPYALRLQNNLAWLAAAADQRHMNHNNSIPIMEAPPPLEMMSTDRIQYLYSDLSTLFAKDIARRQIMQSGQPNPPLTPTSMNGNGLKRGRPDDMVDGMNKRRDMGDAKTTMHPPAGPSVSISANAARSPSASFPGHGGAPASGGMLQSPRVSSPAMPPPPNMPSLPFGVAEAQVAASSRNRARELQIQQAREMQQRQQAALNQMQNASSRMSPPGNPSQGPGPSQANQPSPMGGSGGFSQGAGGGMPNQHPGQGHGGPIQIPQQLMQQYLQVLQNPGHPIMQMLASQIPNFMSLPPAQQIQKLHMVQTLRHQQQRNNQMQSMAQNGQMPGMQNGLMQNANQSHSSSPVSPMSQQSPVMPQQPMQGQSMQNGPFFSPQQNMFMNQGMDPRIGANYQQGSGNRPMDNSYQRQLLLMQQMRGGNASAAMQNMNPQQLLAFQRWQQQGGSISGMNQMPQGGNSVPSGGQGMNMSPTSENHFPALRSNAGIPGIARTMRSPSDSVHSPMTPRTPSRLSQQGGMGGADGFSNGMMQPPHMQSQHSPTSSGNVGNGMQNVNVGNRTSRRDRWLECRWGRSSLA